MIVVAWNRPKQVNPLRSQVEVIPVVIRIDKIIT